MSAELKPFANHELKPVDSVIQELKDLDLDHIELLRGNTYRDTSTVIVVPTRGMIHPHVVHGWVTLAKPMNQKGAMLFVSGDEVGVAYNRAIAAILANPLYAKFPYILTLEDDNIVPSSALLLLLNAIKDYDAVGGLYHMKGGIGIPMAFGTPGLTTSEGDYDMSPRDLTEGILANAIVPVNGIACGCTLWRTELFRKIEPPWFTTWTRFTAEDVVEVMTQDLYFCRKALDIGAKLAVDTRVKVGHIDVATGEVY